MQKNFFELFHYIGKQTFLPLKIEFWYCFVSENDVCTQGYQESDFQLSFCDFEW